MSNAGKSGAKKPSNPYINQLPQALLNAFEPNNRINLYLIENLPAQAWSAKPAGGKGRTIAAMVAHMHNVRVMWLQAAKAKDIPAQLDRATVTPAQAVKGMARQLRSSAGFDRNLFEERWPRPQLSSRGCRLHRLSDHARCPSSRASDDARATTRASFAAESDVRDVGVG